MEENQPIILYRVYENHANFHTNIYFREFTVIRTTPTGYWIKIQFGDTTWYGNGEKWTSSVSSRRFAYPTKEEALQSFIARKYRQILISKATLTRGENAKVAAIEALVAINPNLLPWKYTTQEERKKYAETT